MSRNLILSLFLGIFAITLNSFAFSKGPGDKAEDFTINNFDGNTYRLSDALKTSKSGAVIIFWSTECPWVQPYNDRINDYIKNYNEKGFTVWIINSNSTESTDAVKQHSEKNSYIFPVLKDNNNVVADLYGASRTPEAFVINKDNIIMYHGRITDNKSAEDQKTHDLLNALNEISAGTDVTVKETKSFGCTIKRIEN